MNYLALAKSHLQHLKGSAICRGWLWGSCSLSAGGEQQYVTCPHGFLPKPLDTPHQDVYDTPHQDVPRQLVEKCSFVVYSDSHGEDDVLS